MWLFQERQKWFRPLLSDLSFHPQPSRSYHMSIMSQDETLSAVKIECVAIQITYFPWRHDHATLNLQEIAEPLILIPRFGSL